MVESRYIQAAQRAVGYLAALSPALPPSYSPVSALNAQLTCGAGAALALALLTLGQAEELYTYRESGLRLLGAALHAFTTPDGLPMHTPQDAAAFFPRIPAIWDSELPSPAALLLHALALADACRPQAGYKDAALVLWQAAAPYARPAAARLRRVDRRGAFHAFRISRSAAASTVNSESSPSSTPSLSAFFSS